MEPEVNIRCRESDFKMVESVLQEAAEEYKRMMKDEVKAFAKKDVPLILVLDSNKFLPEYQENLEAKGGSCLGGILLHARRGRIVCTNTLDERLQLVYQEAIPDIREGLFPCFIKPAKPEKAPISEGHHKH